MPKIVTEDPGVTMRNIISGIFISIFAASLGYGVSQASLAVEVKSHTVELKHLKEMDATLAISLSEDRALTREILKQNQEFINLLRVQNEILLQQHP